MTYDSSTDPARVNPDVVLRLLQGVAAEKGFDGGEEFSLVKIADLTLGGKGTYASAKVVCIRSTGAPFGDRPYSVHDAVLVSEGDGDYRVRLINGDYDLTVEEATRRVGL